MMTIIFTATTRVRGIKWRIGNIATFSSAIAQGLIAEGLAIPYEPNKIINRDPTL